MDFALKRVSFLGRECVIICQNENGPCPLLAIANVLLLQNRIFISPDRSFIALNDLVQIIANKLLEETSSNKGTAKAAASAAAEAKMLESVFNILPKMAAGLDLNVFFDAVGHFEFTEEIAIFDSLSIPLLHGWIIDQQSAASEEEFALMTQYSYNRAIFRMVEYKELVEAMGKESRQHKAAATTDVAEKEAKEAALLKEGPLIEGFMNRTAPQLTQAGVLALYSQMRDRQLGVFFRNNHFSSIFSMDGQLFTLTTDQGYLHERAVVWELLVLDGIIGNSEFYNSYFTPLSSLPAEALGSCYAIQDSIAQQGKAFGGSSSSSSSSMKVSGTKALPPSSAATVAATTTTPVAGIDFGNLLHNDQPLIEFDEPSENPLLMLSTATANSSNTSNKTQQQQQLLLQEQQQQQQQPASYMLVTPHGSNTEDMDVDELNQPVLDSSANRSVEAPVATATAAASTAAVSIDIDEQFARALQEEENRLASAQVIEPVDRNQPIIMPSATLSAGNTIDSSITAADTASYRQRHQQQQHSVASAAPSVSMMSQEEADRQHAMLLQAQFEEYDRQNVRPAARAAAQRQQQGRNKSSSNCLVS